MVQFCIILVQSRLTHQFRAVFQGESFEANPQVSISRIGLGWLALDAQFNIKPDLHAGANAAKGFFTGFTLFLIEPVVWFDQDYILEGKAVVTKNGQRVKDVTARTDANISTKWLSLAELPTLEAEALNKAKKSLYLQLMRDIQ